MMATVTTNAGRISDSAVPQTSAATTTSTLARTIPTTANDDIQSSTIHIQIPDAARFGDSATAASLELLRNARLAASRSSGATLELWRRAEASAEVSKTALMNLRKAQSELQLQLQFQIATVDDAMVVVRDALASARAAALLASQASARTRVDAGPLSSTLPNVARTSPRTAASASARVAQRALPSASTVAATSAASITQTPVSTSNTRRAPATSADAHVARMRTDATATTTTATTRVALDRNADGVDPGVSWSKRHSASRIGGNAHSGTTASTALPSVWSHRRSVSDTAAAANASLLREGTTASTTQTTRVEKKDPGVPETATTVPTTTTTTAAAAAALASIDESSRTASTSTRQQLSHAERQDLVTVRARDTVDAASADSPSLDHLLSRWAHAGGPRAGAWAVACTIYRVECAVTLCVCVCA
jgi:hypothetical protein